DPDRAVFIAERLLAGLESDDAQSAVAERGTAVDVETLFVGAAMRADVAHGHDALAGVGPELRGRNESGNAAHNLGSLATALGPRRTVHVFSEPELEHHQAPQPVTVIAFLGPVFHQKFPDRGGLEDPAIAQASVL